MRSLLIGIWMVFTSTAAYSQADFAAADQACAKYKLPIAQAQCLDVMERSVWAEYSPATIGYFNSYADHRLDLARQLQNGQITQPEYDRLISTYHSALIVEQRQAEQQAVTAAQEQRRDQAAALCGLASAFSRRPLTASLNCQGAGISGQAPQHASQTTCTINPLNRNQINCTTN